eukprot:scaffold51977_cov52-Phaeocystis_antarctica.AAC.2
MADPHSSLGAARVGLPSSVHAVPQVLARPRPSDDRPQASVRHGTGRRGRPRRGRRHAPRLPSPTPDPSPSPSPSPDLNPKAYPRPYP